MQRSRHGRVTESRYGGSGPSTGRAKQRAFMIAALPEGDDPVADVFLGTARAYWPALHEGPDGAVAVAIRVGVRLVRTRQGRDSTATS